LAYHLDPKLKEKINRIILLGGALHQTGNLSKSGEYNFASDPHAASLVITAFGDKCTLVPLEVSNKCILDEAEIESIVIIDVNTLTLIDWNFEFRDYIS
jgi:Inosine-uridine nucleoside N-ribohydrolase